jgi:small subunit ribosomal protein S4
MSSYHGPKLKISRALGAPIAETPKHVTPKRQNRPGRHKYRGVHPSLYGIQLKEKKKIASYYNIRNSQLRKYIKQAQSADNPPTRALQEVLECRLDNVIRRLRWARTIWQARQMVSHGHFFLNGRKVNLPSVCVKPGDIIKVKESRRQFVRKCSESTEGMGFRVPGWLSLDQEHLQATVLHQPLEGEVLLPFDVDYKKIIEFYSR